jgi:uncharacterized damage-inducible protein DinB
MVSKKPEAWLRGPIPDVAPEAQPAVFALTQTLEDLHEKVPELTDAELWCKPGGAASVGFHLKHMAGSTDRLIAYAKGHPLSPMQREMLATEKEETGEHQDVLIARAKASLESAIEIIRTTDTSDLLLSRAVGSAGLPSTVLGLYSHAAEHAVRHMGQIITTAKIVRSS